MAKLKKISDSEFIEYVKECNSYASLCKKLQLLGGGSRSSVKKRIESLNLDISHFTGKTWNKGKTKETHPSLKKAGETYKAKGYSTWLGRKHSLETRKKQSLSARSWNNGFIKTKWYKVLNPNTGLETQVQGTWELAFANWLNKNNIPWEKTREKSFSWQKNEEEMIRSYYPDFYLPAADLYIEIKGYMWKSKDSSFDDNVKLKLVKEQNPHIKLIVLMKEELKLLGVEI